LSEIRQCSFSSGSAHHNWEIAEGRACSREAALKGGPEVHLTVLDILFWAAGFLGNLGLLVVVCYRRRAKTFPLFTALVALSPTRTALLYCVLHYGTRRNYYYTYWSLTTVDTLLQLGVLYEISSRVFRPLNVWAQDVRSSFAWLLGLSMSVAFGLCSLASSLARTWVQVVTFKGNLFAAALMSELLVAMMALAVSAKLPWRGHTAVIAKGLGAYSLVTVLIETGHSYFGGGRELPVFVILSHVRMAAYLCCVTYWMINLWRDEWRGRIMTREMHEKIFTLHAHLEYDLQDLRSRNEL
jgi:hypothetical protein